MKTCVFITGTNCTGKSTLAKELIKRYGGVETSSSELTICRDHRHAFVGKYGEGIKYGGVDVLKETKNLEGIIRKAFADGYDYCFAEGSYLHTFGINLTNAMFAADKHLVVLLVAPADVINKRIGERCGGKLKIASMKKQRCAISSAKKWQEIGVPVLAYDTSRTPTSVIADQIQSMI